VTARLTSARLTSATARPSGDRARRATVAPRPRAEPAAPNPPGRGDAGPDRATDAHLRPKLGDSTATVQSLAEVAGPFPICGLRSTDRHHAHRESTLDRHLTFTTPRPGRPRALRDRPAGATSATVTARGDHGGRRALAAQVSPVRPGTGSGRRCPSAGRQAPQRPAAASGARTGPPRLGSAA